MKQRRILKILFFLFLFAKDPLAQTNDSVFLFCYFKGNGDGLHYASSMDGYKWKELFNDSIVLKPAVSKDRLFRDPCITRGGDGMYHMVWTVSWNDKSIGYATSPDLIHWSEQRLIPVMTKEDSAKNAWAPELTYDKRKKKYIIYWATTISGRYPSKDTAAEGRYNHRIYYLTTKRFKKFSKTKLLYDPDFSVIDASIVNNGNNYLMFLKNETKYPVEKNIRIAYAKKVTGPYSRAGLPITGNFWAEGPSALKVGNRWIVYFDKYIDHKYGAVESHDLIHWTDISGKVHFPVGTRHGSAFKISRQEFDKLNRGNHYS